MRASLILALVAVATLGLFAAPAECGGRQRSFAAPACQSGCGGDVVPPSSAPVGYAPAVALAPRPVFVERRAFAVGYAPAVALAPRPVFVRRQAPLLQLNIGRRERVFSAGFSAY